MEDHARPPDTQRQWNDELWTALSRVKNNTNLLPKSQEVRRKRVAEALAFAHKGWIGDIRWEDYAVTLNLAISYARENLGTFVRDDDLPAQRDLTAEARTYLAKVKRQHKINRLHYLEQTGEHGMDLEPDEIEAAERLQQQLGMRHTDDLHQGDAGQISS